MVSQKALMKYLKNKSLTRDRQKDAKVIYPRTEKGFKKWRKAPTKTDLRGWDTRHWDDYESTWEQRIERLIVMDRERIRDSHKVVKHHLDRKEMLEFYRNVFDNSSFDDKKFDALFGN